MREFSEPRAARHTLQPLWTIGVRRRVAALVLLILVGAVACKGRGSSGVTPVSPSASKAGPSAAEPAASAPAVPAAAAESAATTASAPASSGAVTHIVASDMDGDGLLKVVKVVTIGMHVGGGPYDEPTKEPFRKSVEPRFPDLAQCWRQVARPRQADVGVDLVVGAAGGRPTKVSNPRATIEGDGFIPCVVAFFETVEFLPPKNGKTTVSYSVRFAPVTQVF